MTEGRVPVVAVRLAKCSIAAVLVVVWLPAGPAVGGDKALGQYLSSECVTCHQLSGKEVGAIPAIVGLPVDHFITAIRHYRDKKRDNVVMQTIAGRLTDAEIAALAAYFGSLKPAAKP